MNKNITADMRGGAGYKAADKTVAALAATYSIGNRKYIVEPRYKKTSGPTIGKILMRLIEKDCMKH